MDHNNIHIHWLLKVREENLDKSIKIIPAKDLIQSLGDPLHQARGWGKNSATSSW